MKENQMKLVINEHAETQLSNACLPDVLSVADVQRIFGVGRISVYHLIESGQLSAFRMGRIYKIPKVSVEKFLKEWTGDFK